MRIDSLLQFSINRPKTVAALMVLCTLILGALISMVRVDTDPENMLSSDEAVRVFHHLVKKEFSLYDVVVLGVVNEKDRDGVFNPATLKRVEELTDFAGGLADEKDPAKRVVSRDLIAPGNVDSIEQAGLGRIRFKWLMKKAPATREEALKIRDNAMDNPLLKGTMVSEDGRALCIYLPITSKDFAYQVRSRLLEKIASFSGDEQYYITGLPVAEDTFGVEMFIQMAVSAPLAMLAIFLLMLVFFRKLKLIIAPLIVAAVSVICTMGLLTGTGHTLHIMSSMIPIFLMPIAVVDSIHIMSEFFDSYPGIRDRRRTIEHVMRQLFMPMLYTSLTSAAGFASLALTPIPPVQSFGIFVALGIMLAWLFTILFIPAYIMMMKEEGLAGFGAAKDKASGKPSFISRNLRAIGGLTRSRSKLILAFTLALTAVAAYGITKIRINDNPVKWFTAAHPIRVADRVLNRHFGGTYEAYLVLEGGDEKMNAAAAAAQLKGGLAKLGGRGPEAGAIAREAAAMADAAAAGGGPADDFLERLRGPWEERMDAADDAGYEIWAEALDSLDALKNRGQVFKRPDVLRYVERLQEDLRKSGVVGKSNSVADLVKKVHKELFAADPARFRVPDTGKAVAQCLLSFQNSHKPDDLWHLVTPDYRKANIWVQLKSGDNKDMEALVAKVARFMRDNPPPVPLIHQWAGLTYLNVVWQDKMVSGMLESFLGSFLVVLVMMVILFRSLLWGLISMIPLSVTIIFIYGIIGFAGKDYDMPVAVLSSLTLGMAVDFAIHFLERSRAAYKKNGSWRLAAGEMFEEPARAITRNIIVIAVGFTPLLAAPLVPYKTVGVFLASIMAISGLATMLILPAIITRLEPWLFRGQGAGDRGQGTGDRRQKDEG